MRSRIARVVALLVTLGALTVAAVAVGQVSGTATPGDDSITGSDRADVIAALAGDDTVHARGGDDAVDGGAGDDRIDGGRGNDALDGGPGDDRLKDRAGMDTFTGGPGDDRIDARDRGRDRNVTALADTIRCGDGIEEVRADANDVVDATCEHVRRAHGGRGRDGDHGRDNGRRGRVGRGDDNGSSGG